MTTRMKSGWVSSRELAATLGVAVSTVTTWVHQGKLTAEVAVGKVWRFDEGKALEQLKAGSIGAAKGTK